MESDLGRRLGEVLGEGFLSVSWDDLVVEVEDEVISIEGVSEASSSCSSSGCRERKRGKGFDGGEGRKWFEYEMFLLSSATFFLFFSHFYNFLLFF